MQRRIIKHLLVNVLMLVVAAVTFASDEGIVAKYMFSGNANDCINSHHGFASNAVLTEDRFGNPNSAYHFNGVDSYIEVPNTGEVFNLTQAWAISVWVKADPSRTLNLDSRQNPIIWKMAQIGSNADTFTLGFGFGYDNTWGYPNRQDYKPKFVTTTEGVYPDWDYVAVSKEHTPNSWYHIISEYDGQYLTITVNGVEEGRQIYNSPYGQIPINTGPAPLRIGSIKAPYSDHGGYKCINCAGTWFGEIDDIVIYNRALTPDEKLALFKAENPNKVECVDCETSLDKRISATGLGYNPMGAVHVYPNYIWPPNNKDTSILLQGYVAENPLTLLRFGPQIYTFYLLVGQQVVNVNLVDGKFITTSKVKAIKDSIYPIELHVVDSQGYDSIIDSEVVVVGINSSGK